MPSQNSASLSLRFATATHQFPDKITLERRRCHPSVLGGPPPAPISSLRQHQVESAPGGENLQPGSLPLPFASQTTVGDWTLLNQFSRLPSLECSTEAPVGEADAILSLLRSAADTETRHSFPWVRPLGKHHMNLVHRDPPGVTPSVLLVARSRMAVTKWPRFFFPFRSPLLPHS